QRVDLICAIAPPGDPRAALRSATGPTWIKALPAPAPATDGTPAGRVTGPAPGAPAARRPPPGRHRRAHTPARVRTKEIALDPAGVQRDRRRTRVQLPGKPGRAWARGLLGQSPRRLELWFRAPRQVWGPAGLPRSFSCSGLAALLRNAREQGADLGFAVAAVPAERADRRELAGLRPARDRLRVDAEHGGDLSRGQQRLGIRGASGHERPPRENRTFSVLSSKFCTLTRVARNGGRESSRL